MDYRTKTEQEARFPTTPEKVTVETCLTGTSEQGNRAKSDGLVEEAFNWLATHRQPDDEIRRRTSDYLLNFQNASEVEVAAALLSDLPPEADLTGISPETVQLALKNSKVYTTEEIKKEKSNLSALRYRIWRCIAEASGTLDRTDFSGEFDVPMSERKKKITRWKEVAHVMSKKPNPGLSVLAQILEDRIKWLIKKFTYIQESPFGYEIKGPPEAIERFSAQYVSYLFFNELRVNPKTLWISHNFFCNSVLVRLMDWLSRRDREVKVSLLSSEKVTKIPIREYNDDEFDWLGAAERILSNSLIINPAELLYQGRRTYNLKGDISRLQVIGYGRVLEKDNFDFDEAEIRWQRRIRESLPKEAISSLEWQKLHPGRDLYVLTFNCIFPEKQLFPVNVESVPGRRFILDWIAKNLSGITLKPVYIEEYLESDGSYLIPFPYRGDMLLEGPQEEIDKFTQAWRDSEGRSLDPRWELVLYPCKEKESESSPN